MDQIITKLELVELAINSTSVYGYIDDKYTTFHSLNTAIPTLAIAPSDPFAIFFVYLAKQQEEVSRPHPPRMRFGSAIATRRHSPGVLASLASFTIRDHKRERLITFLIPALCDHQRVEDVSL